MEELIPEIFDMILGHLDTRDRARLLCCSKRLTRRLEPVLYGSVTERSKALRWACIAGNSCVADRAVSYGADPSILQGQRECQAGGASRPARVLTLYLAAKHDQPQLFNHLVLHLGAQINGCVSEPNETRTQVRKMMQWLCRRPSLHVCLQTVLDRYMDRDVQAMHCNAIAWPLALAIEGGATTRILEQLIRRGANPNERIYRNLRRNDVTPLSSTILSDASNKAEILDLLTDAGASIHGTGDVVFPPSVSPTHIPVFAAARAMALCKPGDNTGRKVMSYCLAHGADIAQYACQWGDKHRYWGNEDTNSWHRVTPICYYTTPFLLYLDSIRSWPETAVQTRLGDMEFLLSNGARIVSPTEIPPGSSAPCYTCLESPSSIELLLNKWALRRLAEPGFADVLVFLAERGGAASREKNVLLNYQWHGAKKKSGQERTKRLLGAWRRIVAAVIKHYLASNLDSAKRLDRLLADLVMDKAQATYYRTDLPQVDDMFRLTMSALVESGTDINAPVLDQGMTPLCAVCNFYSTISTDKDRWGSHGLTTPAIVGRRMDLVALLVSLGADPSRKSSGMSAAEVLLARRDQASPWGLGFLLEVEKILQGTTTRLMAPGTMV